eukprot:UN34187
MKNGFQIYSSERSFVAFTDERKEREDWIKQLKIQKDGVKDRRAPQLSPTAVKPIWDSLDNTRDCQMPTCKTEFGLFVKGSHCRFCGRLTCKKCLKYLKITENKKGNKPRGKKSVVCSVMLFNDKNLQNKNKK